MKRNIVLCLIALSALSCKKEGEITATDTCKLARIANYGTNDFTYDATGNLVKWVITTPLSSTTTEVVQYDFTRDATSRISSLTQTITANGKTQASAVAQFSYTNGLLTSTSTTVDPAKPGSISRNFSYDSQGRMSQRVVSDKTDGFTSTETYAYDSRGNYTTYTYTDSYGVKNEFINTYDTSKNPQQLLIKSIPFNLRTGLPWLVNTIQTSKETYVAPTGSDTYTSKQTDLKTDAKGYVTSSTLTYNDGYVATVTYSLINCQ